MSELLSSIKKAFVDTVLRPTVEYLQELRNCASGLKTSQILVVGAASSTLLSYFLWRKQHRLPPGPFALSLVGNVFAFRKKEPFYVTLHRWATESYGPLITLQLGPVRCVTLNSLDVVLEALVEKGEAFSGRLQLCSLGVQTENFRDIIFANDSAEWRLRKSLATRALRCYMESERRDEVVHHVVNMVTDKMALEKDAFNPHPYISILIFHLLDTLCFGKKTDFDDPSIQRISTIFRAFSEEVRTGFLEDLLPFLQHVPTRKFGKFQELTGQFLD
ncbi:hypothetical protein ACOMHN_025604 [Nucella lapillus]